MDAGRIDLVMEFALAVAARQDDPWRRSLGAIHLIKYVYIADLSFAEAHEGSTFTGTPWRFYKFGPWSESAFERVADVIRKTNAHQTSYESTKYENDVVRWYLDERDADLVYARASDLLPHVVASRVRKAVREHGSDTTALLHYVYGTKPMLRAAPNEPLNFRALGARQQARTTPSAPKLTRKQEKRQKAAIETLRSTVATLLAKKKAEQATRLIASPRYDEVFFMGTAALDGLGDMAELPESGELVFPPDIWKSGWREGEVDDG
jgi:hypothetical protein